MKTLTPRFLAVALCLNLFAAHAQMGGMGGPPRGPRGPQGPQISASMAKLFGANSAFSANIENTVKLGANGEPMTMPGKLAYDSGKSRFEMNLGDAKGSQMPPGAAAQMKAMGMDQMVTISRPDKKKAYVIYPGLEAYAEMPITEPDTEKSDTDFKMNSTELGKETIDGHDCVKKKVVITAPNGETHESTVWNAADLKDFPVKIEMTERGQPITMLFKDVKLSKPDSALFDPPSGYKTYTSMQELMQQEMMKKMGGGMGMPPRQ